MYECRRHVRELNNHVDCRTATRRAVARGVLGGGGGYWGGYWGGGGGLTLNFFRINIFGKSGWPFGTNYGNNSIAKF